MPKPVLWLWLDLPVLVAHVGNRFGSEVLGVADADLRTEADQTMGLCEAIQVTEELPTLFDRIDRRDPVGPS